MHNVTIEGITIGQQYKPFIIAEMSGNHNQSLERAFKIVDAAAEAGVHAIKLQTYTADTMTMMGLITINAPGSAWHGRELYNLYKEAHTPWEWHKDIFKRAKKRGLIVFSTPFDETAVDFLMELDAPAYKIASFECTHMPLLKKIAKTGKPVIMSTGMATLAEIEESVKVLRDAGCNDLILLKCTSSYPASPVDSNITTIPNLADNFNCIVGLSDHTLGIGVAVASVALGARVIEKHFTLDRTEGGVDSAFSLEPDEMRALVKETKNAFDALGQIKYGTTKSEENSLRFRRSIYVIKDIRKGEVFTNKNIKIIRPGDGIAPKYIDLILGKKARQGLKRATPLTFDVLL
ncbi:MAG: pseudaminic acid synthase [Cytophagales bacterium]|nr:pseudaminic acid synthase [Cytophagales bacterium]